MQCTKRGDGASCTYQSAIPKEQEEVPRASEAQLRLRKLEQMVNSLMKNNRGSESCESETLPQGTPKRYLNQSPLTTSSGGLVNVNHSESSYHGATHWQAILQNVSASSRTYLLSKLKCCRFEISKSCLKLSPRRTKKYPRRTFQNLRIY
jgi:hypothetical protein